MEKKYNSQQAMKNLFFVLFSAAVLVVAGFSKISFGNATCSQRFISKGSNVLLQLNSYRIRDMVPERVDDLIRQASPGDIQRLTPATARALLLKASPLMQKKVIQALNFNQIQDLTRGSPIEEKQEIERIFCGKILPIRAALWEDVLRAAPAKKAKTGRGETSGRAKATLPKRKRRRDRGCDELIQIGAGLLLLGIFSG